MADTPLPQRCASSTQFLLCATNSAAQRAASPVCLNTETFPRLSVPSERFCGAACPYLDRLSCGESRVLSACFGSSAPLPPRLLRHLYRDPGWATAQAQLLPRFLFRHVLFRAPCWGGQNKNISCCRNTHSSYIYRILLFYPQIHEHTLNSNSFGRNTQNQMK